MSFRLKTILGIALIQALLLTLLIGTILGTLRDSHEKALTDRAAATAALFATLTKEAVLSLDLAALESFVAEVSRTPGVRYARVFDGDGRLLAQRGDPAPLARPFRADRVLEDARDGIFDTYAEITEAGILFGRVEVGISIEALQRVLDEVRTRSLAIAVAVLVLVALFSLVLGNYLTRQLKGLAEASRALAAGDLGRSIPVKGDDELAETARTFNRMSHTLAEELGRRDAILRSALDCIIGFDSLGRIIEFNPAAERVLGHRRDEAIDLRFADTFIPAEQRAAFMRGLLHYHECGELRFAGRHIQTTVLHADGTPLPVEIAYSPSEEGGRRIVTAYLRDIRDRLQAEERLRKLSTAVEQSPISVVITDLEGVIEYVNPRFTAVTGYTFEEARGANPRILKSGRNAPQVYRGLWTTITAGNVWHGELLNQRKNGELYWEETTICPVRDEQGATTHYLAIKEDISERKRIIAELHQAKEEAESANHAKSEFLATMSHEIRTPMNAILGMGELLSDTELNREQRQYLEILNRGGKNLLELIDDILDLSRIEANRLELNPEPFDLSDLIHGVAQVLGVRARQKGLEVHVNIAEGTPRFVIGDAKRLRQILVNLMGNAIKFTHHGGITVTAEPFGESEPPMIQFSVIDTGIGISEEKRVTIFDPFTQADGSVTRDYGGTGLGLSISTKLAELMGGCLWVTSEEGQGSTFAFTAAFAIPHREAVTEANGVDLTGSTVALIGCQEITNEVFHSTLTPLGARLEVIRDCKLGLEASRRATAAGEHWAALIVEQSDPAIDAFAFLERLRESDHGYDLPVVMISPLRRKADLERAHELHALMLPAPVESHQLVKAIAATLADLDRERGAAPAAAAAPSPTAVYILLAEDSPDNSVLIETHLRKSGHRFRTVANGREAVEASAEERFDLILMDIQMPVMDGYSATRAIREREAREGIEATPILALTAHALKEDEEKSLAAGCDGHLTKPVKKRDLLAAIERYAHPTRHSPRRPIPVS